MKSTPIQDFETITGLHSLDGQKNAKLLTQTAKFKRLQDQPHERQAVPVNKGATEEREFYSPEQDSGMTTPGHP